MASYYLFLLQYLCKVLSSHIRPWKYLSTELFYLYLSELISFASPLKIKFNNMMASAYLSWLIIAVNLCGITVHNFRNEGRLENLDYKTTPQRVCSAVYRFKGLSAVVDKVRIGLVYLIAGFGGSLMSSLFIQTGISVGASGALFGLLGSMLSELITNWTIYANKLAALLTLILIIVINLAMGILPHVDNFAHIGGFLSGFLLGFVFLIRPQFGYVSEKHVPPGYIAASRKPKHKPYQYVLWVISLILLIVGYTVGLVLLLRGVNLNDHCSWCHYMSCIPTSLWSCKSQQAYCESIQYGNQLNLTCISNGKSNIYTLSGERPSQAQQLCSNLCG
ncbi:RHOMBOID-like protein 1 isoform X2 [Durio zibethinus]|uniref:RHOMBOID-like protein n=1 Tax=Durio zibethinus TaxID=66656 RepID=A0A6P5ZTP4_DURZI|nr:RHOMBOID-like protein 1 isoform X2 [Durio zibethinus]